MKTVNVHQAKTQLSRLLEEVAAGQEIIIAKAGKPVARLVSLRVAAKKRQLGILESKLTVPPDFDAPLPDAILEAFEEKG
jgi:prevent-host-death family protein